MPKQKRGSKSSSAKQRELPGPVLHTVGQIQKLVENHSRWEKEQQECMRDLDQLVATLKLQQSDNDPCHNVIPDRTKEDFALFSSWLKEYGICSDIAPFTFGFVEDEDAPAYCNATLYASRNIAPDELIVSVPSDVMLSVDMAERSSIAPLLKHVPTLRSMPSITLALMLLAEAIDPSSTFQPYIRILPRAFTIPFDTFDSTDLLAMRPSLAADGAVKSLRAQLRNYSYVYLALTRIRQSTLPIWAFSYVNFVWAISVVMTRQNALPIRNPPPLALVPVWDMCNHAQGEHTTSVVMSPADGKLSVECRAMKAFDSGENISIFYGARPNHQLLLFSGFVQENNPHDVVSMTVAIDASAELAAFKARILGKGGMEVVKDIDGSKWKVAVNVNEGGNNISKLIALCRVISMDKAGINTLLKSGENLPLEELDEVTELAARELARDEIEKRLMEYEVASTSRCDEGKVGSTAYRLIERLHAADIHVLRKGLSKV